MNYVHVQGPTACPICGKISANRKALRKHQTIHIESWKDRFKCIICGRGFRDSTKLKVSAKCITFEVEISNGQEILGKKGVDISKAKAKHQTYSLDLEFDRV